jgi:hypothetical protein
MKDHQEAVEQAQIAEADPDEQIYGLSVECFDVGSQDEALRCCTRPNKRVRVTTAARIRGAGLDVIPTWDEPHATLAVPKPLDAGAWHLVRSLFDDPIENPYRRRG